MKLIKSIVAAALALAMSAAFGQQYDPVGGGARFNITAGSIDCRTGLCTITPSTTQGIVGTATNDSANAGAVGEFLTTTVATASAVSLSTATAKDIMTLALTAGDWDVAFQIRHKPAASTSVTILSCSLSATVDTMGTQPGGSGIGTDNVVIMTTAANVLAGEFTQASMPIRVSLAATTTIHVVCNDTFTVSTMAAYGTVRARRVR